MRTSHNDILGGIVRETDAQHPDLEEVPAATEEEPAISVQDIHVIASDTGGDPIFVDWSNGSIQSDRMPHPVIAIVNARQDPIVSIANITWKKVDPIVQKPLNNEIDLGSEDAPENLQKLSPLIEPLVSHSKPAQILVFSPIGDLHRISLHIIRHSTWRRTLDQAQSNSLQQQFGCPLRRIQSS